ncbi:hypothetical protein [Streptomyces sp. NBC_00076]|uniref:hypothetical protein n=1 Tax=Streptomyces sp. NBC_00076 TaxID=2975642 RepID=UPI00324ACAD3
MEYLPVPDGRRGAGWHRKSRRRPFSRRREAYALGEGSGREAHDLGRDDTDDHADLVVLLGGRVDAEVLVRELVRESLVLVREDLGGAANLDRGVGVGEPKTERLAWGSRRRLRTF